MLSARIIDRQQAGRCNISSTRMIVVIMVIHSVVMLLLMLCSYVNITFLKCLFRVLYRRSLYVLFAILVREAVYSLCFCVHWSLSFLELVFVVPWV